MIKEAMEFLESYFEKPLGYPAIICGEFREAYEKPTNPNAVADCYVNQVATDQNDTIIAYRYSLGVYTKFMTYFTEKEWVAIFIHELMHGLGFNQFGFDSRYTGFIGETPMTDDDLALRSPRFEEAVLGYKRQVPTGTAVPLENLGHILGPGKSYDGNPGLVSMMNATTDTNLLIEMDSIYSDDILKKYGYIVKKIAPKNIQQYALPRNFVCGTDS